jgi:transposase
MVTSDPVSARQSALLALFAPFGRKVVMFFARLPRALVGIEACPGGHHWARELRSLGHDVRLIPPQYVRPFVKTNKNDAADAEGICEAVVRPNMRFVAIKSIERQAAIMRISVTPAASHTRVPAGKPIIAAAR